MTCAILLACSMAAASAVLGASHERNATAETLPRARVLVVFASPPEYTAMRAFGDALRLTIRNELARPVEFFEEFLDFNRFGGATHQRQLAEYLATKYQAPPPDLIVAVEVASVGFIREYLYQELGGPPVVFGWIAEGQIAMDTLPPYVTGVLGAKTIRATLDMALRLHPKTRRVAVIGGTSASDRELARLARSVLAPLRDTLQLEFLANLSHEELLSRVRSLSPRSIILFGSFMQDADGRFYVPSEVVQEVAGVATAPVYGNVDVWMGRGIVGGYIMSATENGRSTGHLAATVLASPRTLSLPAPITASAEYIADWRQMQRWQLPNELLPAGTRVMFRARTWWEQTRTTFIGAFVLVALQSLLIALLLHERRRRRVAQGLSGAVLRSSSSPIAILDRGGTIVLVNPAWSAAAEASEASPANESGIGANYVEAWRLRSTEEPEHATSILEGIGAVLDGRAAVFGAEYDGGSSGERRFQLLVERLDRPEGGAVVTHVDITERTMTERVRDEWRRQTEHLNRAATLGELAASLSHELGQPLTSIRANAQAGKHMVAQKGGPREVGEILIDIEADSIRAGAIVHRVRGMLRKQAPVVESVALNRVCRGVAHLLHSSALLRQTRIVLELHEPLPNVLADRVQMEQVVLNLVMNAIDACASASGDRVVRVRTAVATRHETVVSVIDVGPGIGVEAASRLFEPFFTTKKWGLGVGLSIVRSLITAHGGHVWAENVPTGGAAFHFSLPASLDVEESIAGGDPVDTPTALEAVRSGDAWPALSVSAWGETKSAKR